MTALVQQLTKELNIRPEQIEATIALIDDGASVPFIARYRKEQTQGLDDTQLRQLHTRLVYLRDLNERKDKVIQSLKEQEKYSEDLAQRIEQAPTKVALEEIYSPYRPKRTSKSFKAKEAGLADYADKVLNQDVVPAEVVADFSHENYADEAAKLEAIQHIIIDQWAQNIPLSTTLKADFAKTAELNSAVASDEKREVGQKFRDYFEWSEKLNKVPSHRLLAMLRGRQENVLTLKVSGEDQPALDLIAKEYQLEQIQPEVRRDFLQQTAKLFWLGKLRPQIEHALLTEKRLFAETQAIDVFAENLRHLLLSAPAGARYTLGVDPGIRTGVKLAVIDQAGDTQAHSTIYPFEPKKDKAGALAELKRLCSEYPIDLVAIGNGTASRETDNLFAELIKENPELKITRVITNEAGASVYSASELASQELPELDVTIRGAVSIARRLQDPLAELVKIDPKAIGVGQYQHDVNQNNLASSLDVVVEDCVNAVGVDVNTASPAILSRIAGLNRNIAQQIVDYRKENGRFNSREQLKQVPRLGERTFEQAAGFLRIHDGEQPLDQSAVHPEAYPLVEEILAKHQISISELIGNSEIIHNIDSSAFVNERFGLPTISDVLKELEKPGRDPRPEFKTAKFNEDITEVAHLTEGLMLEGVVTNVTNFGAFVDIGVHQDALVHISELSNGFVSDPHKIVHPGDIVKVRVLQVDVERNRVNLTMKTERTEKTAATKPNQRSKPAAQARKPNATHSKKPQHKAAAKKEDNNKVGGLGALLLQAGIRSSKDSDASNNK